MRILVIGGSGTVGRYVCREIVRVLGAGSVVVGDRVADRGARWASELGDRARTAHIDIRDMTSVSRAIEGLDGVIVAAPQTALLVQEVCTNFAIPCIDIVPDSARLTTQAPKGTIGVVAAGLIPGLSGIMAATLAAGQTNRTPIDVSLLQRANGSAGAVGIADMLRLFTYPVRINGHEYPGFSRRRTTQFPKPFGKRTVKAVAFPEAGDLTQRGGIAARYWTAFDSPAMNVGISAARALGVLKSVVRPNPPHPIIRRIAARKAAAPPADERIAVTAEAADGASIAVVGPSDYEVTAMVAVALTRIVAERTSPLPGLVLPFECVTLAETLAMIDSPLLTLFHNDTPTNTHPA